MLKSQLKHRPRAADFVVAENSAGEKVEFNHPIFQADIILLVDFQEE